MLIIFFWVVWGLVCGLAMALPTRKIDTTCISVQTGLILNCLSALVGMAGGFWPAVLLAAIGSSVVVYARVVCKRCYAKAVRS